MRQWKYAWLIMLCCLASTFSYAFTSYEINGQCRVDLYSISKVKTDSNLQLPQNGWEPVKMLPDRWDETWPNYSGGAWYKLEWTWQCRDDARLAEPIAFSLDYINAAGAVFLNGDMLWSDRHLQEPLSKSWNMPRFWVMPISGLENGSNEILIYVYGYAVQSAGIGKIGFNNVMQADAAHQQIIWNTRTLFQINIILSGVLGIICLVIWLFRRSESSFGWFALSSLLWICFISYVLVAETVPFPNSLAASRANLCFFILYILCFCIYLLRFISVRKPKLERAMLLLTAGFILSIWTVSLSMMKPLFGTVFLFYCGVFLLMYLYLCWTAFRTRHAESIFLAVCMTAIVSFAVFDVYMVYADISNDIAPLSPYTSPLITLFIVVILGARLNRNIKKIEQFNEELSTKVQQVSLDLSSSLNDKHRLALFNARLQERMKLSHDLHDGLGASIVRSMILVDQCEKNIPNQQFLSMLKLLRDDLRQIIDSGSASDDKIPESPILWVAPVRHRFSQLMDELDIHAAWRFAQRWEAEPSALQCLNLIRVLEESLTNVLKHSQATHVQVGMSFSGPHQLELVIQDNGVGFDVDCVKQNGMSIGMRSMKTRVERMGGQLNIRSVKGETVIQAIINLKSS